MATTKRTRLSSMLDSGVKNPGSDRQAGGDEHDRPTGKCSAHGCPLRADIFVSMSDSGRGLCKFHYRARGLARDSADVTTRIRNRADLIRQVERLALAPLELADNPRRYAAVVRIATDSGTAWGKATYPAEIPLGKNECHVAWVERANDHLHDEIVLKARPNPHM